MTCGSCTCTWQYDGPQRLCNWVLHLGLEVSAKGHVGDVLAFPHDGLHDDDEVHLYLPCACGTFLSLVENYGWCSTCTFRLHGKDAFDDVLYPLDVVDDHERMYVVEDSWCLVPLVEDDVGSPYSL